MLRGAGGKHRAESWAVPAPPPWGWPLPLPLTGDPRFLGYFQGGQFPPPVLKTSAEMSVGPWPRLCHGTRPLPAPGGCSWQGQWLQASSASLGGCLHHGPASRRSPRLPLALPDGIAQHLLSHPRACFPYGRADLEPSAVLSSLVFSSTAAPMLSSLETRSAQSRVLSAV